MIEALFLGAPVTYRLDAQALAFMERGGVGSVRERLAAMTEAPMAAAQFEPWFDLRFPQLPAEQRERVLTAAALAGYQSQTEVPIIQALLSDDAAVFHGIVDTQGLCWIHDFRHYLQLVPERASQERQLVLFKRRYWKLYRRLLRYREAPTSRERARLERAFDRLVQEAQAPPFLAECIARTRKNKEKLLLVLEYPELPLHNNAAELAVRRRVRKRGVSFGPVSAAGREAWDTFQGLAGTLEKLGVSFWSYLEDRTHETGAIPPLPELIRQRAHRTRRSSWAPT